MAKKTPPAPKPGPEKTNTGKKTETMGSVDRLDSFLEKRRTPVFWICVLCAFVLSLVLFDVKISTGNDDALYIEAGYNYAHDFFGYYYSATAPLYTMFLALPIAIWGINMVILKLFSVVFFVAGLYFVYRNFRGRIPYSVLFFSLFITATNYMFLVHASLTYTETFFAMIQAIFLSTFIALIEKVDSPDFSWKGSWKTWLAFGIMMFIQYMTRNVAIGTVIAVVLYFLVRKQWKFAAVSAALFAVFVGAFEVVKRSIWGSVNQFGSQGNVMFMKDAYNPAEGKEDLAGFVNRFFTNTEIYFSSRFWEILGFRKEDSMPNGFITLLTIALIVLGLVFMFRKKNHTLLASTFYFGTLCGITFISLHTSWGQGRLVMVYLSYIMFAIFYGLYQLFHRLKGYQFFFPLLALILVFVNLGNTLGKTGKNLPTLKKNLKGDIYYGYTPDWVNYLKASRWCADSLPKEDLVACRKAPMSFVYGNGRNFFPIYNVPFQDADSLARHLKENHVTHVLIAELRLNPKKAGDGYVNTIHRFLAPIYQKYPDCFELVHQEGKSEVAQVIKIHYEDIHSLDSAKNAPRPSEQDNLKK